MRCPRLSPFPRLALPTAPEHTLAPALIHTSCLRLLRLFTQAVYVGAGALGRQALQGGVKLPRSVVALGVLATAAAIVLIGHVAQQTIKGMDLEEAAMASRS